MNVAGMGIPPQQNPQQQQQPPQPLDNISKIKSLIGPLRESLSYPEFGVPHFGNGRTKLTKTVIQGPAQGMNCFILFYKRKGVDVQIPRFDKCLEEFYSICDQIELHLKTSIKCLSQGESGTKYLHLLVAPTRSENLGIPDNTLTYPQFLSTVNAQIAFTKEIHDTLVAAAQNISPSD